MTDIINQIYTNEAEKHKWAMDIMQEQRKLGSDVDDVTKLVAYKNIIFDILKEWGKKVTEVEEQELLEFTTRIRGNRKAEWFTYAFACILAEYYGLLLRIVDQTQTAEGVPQRCFDLIKKYGRTHEAYYEYVRNENGELNSDGTLKTTTTEIKNVVNVINMDATHDELTNRKKKKRD